MGEMLIRVGSESGLMSWSIYSRHAAKKMGCGAVETSVKAPIQVPSESESENERESESGTV